MPLPLASTNRWSTPPATTPNAPPSGQPPGAEATQTAPDEVLLWTNRGRAAPFPFFVPTAARSPKRPAGTPTPTPPRRSPGASAPPTVTATAPEAQAAGRPSRPASHVPQSLPLPEVLKLFGAHPRLRQITLWPTQQQQLLCVYLNRLMLCADLVGTLAQARVCRRLETILAAAADLPAYVERAMLLVQLSLAHHGDHVIRGLDEMELALALCENERRPVPQATIELVDLGFGVMRLHALRQEANKAQAKAPHITLADVTYVFESQLRTRLGLPGSTVTSQPSPMIPQAQIDEAAAAVEDRCARLESKHTFFEQWPPWLQLLRRGQAERSNYVQLPSHARADASVRCASSCPLTRRAAGELKHATYVGEGDDVRVYDHDALMVWWVAHGTEPTTCKRLELSQLWRLAD